MIAETQIDNLAGISFKLHARNFALTFPKSEKLMSKEQVFDLLTEKMQNYRAKLKEMIVSYEQSDTDHAYEHYHVYLSLDRKFHVQDARLFDLNFVHGQYESCKNVQRWKNYVKKDGVFVVFKLLDDKPSASDLVEYFVSCIKKIKQFQQLRFVKCWKQVYDTLNNSQKAVFNLNLQKIVNAIKSQFLLDDVSFLSNVKSYDNYFLSQEIKEWIANDSFSKTLILSGPTRIGKTGLAKYILKKLLNYSKVLVISHLDRLVQFQEGDYDAILLNDLKLPKQSQDRLTVLNLLSRTEEGINIEIRNRTVDIDTNIPMIITTNKSSIEEIFNIDDLEAIDTRITFIRVEEKLFS